MDADYFAKGETVERRAVRPMFVAPERDDNHERHIWFAADPRHADEGAPLAVVEHDWITERMMDSYN